MKIILIRHGKTRGNTLRRYVGSTDEELCPDASFDYVYPDCDAVVSSPMKRCLQTAKLIYPDKDVKICPSLRECDFGDFENKSYEDLKDDVRYKRWLDSGGDHAFPNGEEPKDFRRRSVSGFYASLEEEAQNVAFVVHGGTIMAIMCELFGGGFYDYMTDNGGGYVVEYDGKEKTARGFEPLMKGEKI